MSSGTRRELPPQQPCPCTSGGIGAFGRIRTYDLTVNSRLLYLLSYKSKN